MTTAFDEKRDAIARILKGSSSLELAMTLVDALSKLDHQHSSFLSYRSLATLVGVRSDVRELLECVTLLTSPRINVLSPMFVYAPQDREEYVLSKVEWSQAKKLGYLVDPESGEKVENFEDLTYPYFATTADFERVASHR